MRRTSGQQLGDLTQAEKILLSFYRSSGGTTSRVPFEDVVLQAWRDFPSDFSLPNTPAYPDAYPIGRRIYSDLITGRFVVSLKSKSYRLTEKGIREAQRLLQAARATLKQAQIPDLQLDRDEKAFLDNALRSRTFAAWKRGDQDGLIDYDARVFFQFSTGTPVKSRIRKMQMARDAVGKALASGLPEAKELHDLCLFLADRFAELFEDV